MVIGVIAVLLGVTLPALSGARRSARIVEGQSHIRQVLGLFAAASNSNAGYWPTRFQRDVEFETLGMGNTVTVSPHVLIQTELWAIALLGDVPASLLIDRYLDYETAAIVTAPVIYATSAERFAANPQAGGAESYLYSPALFTDDALWAPHFPERRLDPDAFRRRVGVHDVRHPAEKAALADRADHYETAAPLEKARAAAPEARFNVGFADGSVRRLSAGQSTPPLDVAWPEDEVEIRGAVPFVCTPDGSSGRDVQ